ncbi:MAG: CorA family divalent cation transporter [Rhodospirillaceae bacterium]
MLDDSNAGLIAGYTFLPEQRGRRLTWADAQQRETAEDGCFRWLHLNLAMRPARRWLEEASGLPDSVVEGMLDADPHYHVVSTAQGFLLTLHDVILGQSENPRESTGLIAIWVDRGQMITIRRWPMLCTDRLIKAVEGDDTPASSIDLFLRLFDQIVDTFRKRVVRLRIEIDKDEDKMLAGQTGGLRSHLAGLRREAVAMHRRIVPEFHGINQLAARLPAWVTEDEQAFFRQMIDEVGSLINDIRSAQERTKVLQDEYAAMIAEETNSNLYVLSIVTVIMLPMTFVTGYFGMNTASLPLTSPDGMGSMASSVIILVVGVLTAMVIRYVLLKNRRDR